MRKKIIGSNQGYYRIRITLTSFLIGIPLLFIIDYLLVYEASWVENFILLTTSIFSSYSLGAYMDNNAEYFDDKGLIKRNKLE